MTDPRKAAHDALRLIDGGVFAQAALAQAAENLSARDRKLCSDLVYGTLRARPKLREELAKFLAKPGKLPPSMRIYLELAACSIYCQDKIPSYAIVNETTRLIKRQFGQKLANVANAALRRILAAYGLDVAENEKQPDKTPGRLPDEIAELWRRAYGDAVAGQLAARSLQRPSSALRVNLAHPQGRELIVELGKLPQVQAIGAAGFAFPPGKRPKSIMGQSLQMLLAAGAMTLQAAGSMLVLQELGLYERWKNAPVWDACAGVGGKSMALMEAGLGIGLCTDKNLKRLARLPEDCARLGLPCPSLALADAKRPPVSQWPGHILADVPCSGLGVLSRRPDLIDRQRKEKREQLVEMQRKILHSLTETLKPGHELAYLTCTLNPEENELQIRHALATHGKLELISQWQTPHDHPWLEGMYGALLRKKDS